MIATDCNAGWVWPPEGSVFILTQRWPREHCWCKIGPARHLLLGSSMVEHSAVNRNVVGSSPTRGAKLFTLTVSASWLTAGTPEPLKNSRGWAQIVGFPVLRPSRKLRRNRRGCALVARTVGILWCSLRPSLLVNSLTGRSPSTNSMDPEKKRRLAHLGQAAFAVRSLGGSGSYLEGTRYVRSLFLPLKESTLRPS